jgi:TonB-dependent receptor
LRREAVSGKKFRASDLSILALGATLLAPYAIAADADQDATTTNTAATKSDEDLTEILVTGIRKALATSQEIKKESDTVVDSITASDIGAFPDKSVAEALQRMTGITVTRFAASGDTTHFSAEPSGVVIRGLPQVRSEFNGRDSFNANSSRGLSFGDVSPELMSGVDTYKNATADMIEGGLAGTVNLRTATPFDSEGFVAAFSAEMGYGKPGRRGQALRLRAHQHPLGNRNRRFRRHGQRRDCPRSLPNRRAYSCSASSVRKTLPATAAATKWIPGGIDIRRNTYDRTRKGASVALQWSSPEDTVSSLLQYNRSEY